MFDQILAETGLTREELKQIAAVCYEDPIEFCYRFFPEKFKTPIPWVHRGLIAILLRRCDFLEKYGDIDKIISNFQYEDKDGARGDNDEVLTHPIFYRDRTGKLKMRVFRYTVIFMPRGFSKTTICGNMVPVFKILYRIHHFMAYVSETAEHAVMQMDNIKDELVGNERIKLVFGELKPAYQDAERWSAKFFETMTECAMVARGRGGQVRGLNNKGHRPSLVIADDLEDEESVATPEQREKVKRWFYAGLMPVIQENDPESSIAVIGTMLHRESLMQTLARDPQWTCVRFGVYDRQGDLLWPYMMTEEKLQIKKRSAAKAGQLHAFYMEYFNIPADPDSQPFKPSDMLHDYKVEAHHKVIYVDPAISEKRQADDAVIVVCGINAAGIYSVLDVWGKQGCKPRELVDQFFKMAKEWKCNLAGVESNAYQAALTHIIRDAMYDKQWFMKVEAITHKTKKTERILAVLQPLYINGRIVHRKHWEKLEEQLLEFTPDGGAVHDDYPDAVAGGIALLSPWAANAAGLQNDLAENEFEPLDDWRNH